MAQLSEKILLLNGLLTGNRAKVGPLFATIDLTRRCNLQCPGCRYHSPEASRKTTQENDLADISRSLFVKICTELKQQNTKSIILLGEGEPLLHPEVFDFIRDAKRYGFHITLFTNGTLLTEERCEALVEASPDLLKVSLWGNTPETYKLNHPNFPSSLFERVITGLSTLSALKKQNNSSRPLVTIHQPINRLNYLEVGNLVDIALHTSTDAVSFSPLKILCSRSAELALSYEQEKELRLLLSKTGKELDKNGISHNSGETLSRYRIGNEVWRRYPCYIGWLHTRIKINGDVYPCNPCDWPVGNLQEDSLASIWNSERMREFRGRSITKSGLFDMGDTCQCSYCCHVLENKRVHDHFKWVSPLRKRSIFT